MMLYIKVWWRFVNGHQIAFGVHFFLLRRRGVMNASRYIARNLNTFSKNLSLLYNAFRSFIVGK